MRYIVLELFTFEKAFPLGSFRKKTAYFPFPFSFEQTRALYCYFVEHHPSFRLPSAKNGELLNEMQAKVLALKWPLQVGQVMYVNILKFHFIKASHPIC